MAREDGKYKGLEDNKNAEKWTEDDVINLLSSICDRTKDPEIYLISQAIEGLCTQGQYDYLVIRFADSATVSSLRKSIASNCEKNLATAALAGKVKETMSIFLLKAKYGLVDKQQVEVEHKGSISVNFNLQPDTDTDPDSTDLTDPT